MIIIETTSWKISGNRAVCTLADYRCYRVAIRDRSRNTYIRARTHARIRAPEKRLASRAGSVEAKVNERLLSGF